MPEFETDAVVLFLIALGLCSAAAIWVHWLFRILDGLIADRRHLEAGQ